MKNLFDQTKMKINLRNEYQNEKERLNKEKMKKVRGLIFPVEQFKIQRD